MLKIADSAAIRHHIPTRPRNSCESGISACGTGMVVAAKPASPYPRSLLILPVRIFRMFQIPQRTAAAHHRDPCKVVIWRRGTRTPLQCPSVPWVVARQFAFEVRRDQVVDKYQN